MPDFMAFFIFIFFIAMVAKIVIGSKTDQRV